MTQAGITPPATVRLLCDYAEPQLSNPSTKLFEPGCGDGNFLVGILDRRLQKIQHHSATVLQNDVLLTVANLYGIDIRPIAIAETRHRLQLLATNFVTRYSQPDYRFTPLLEQILAQNFIVADLLRDYSKITFPFWQKVRNFEFCMTPTIFPKEKKG